MKKKNEAIMEIKDELTKIKNILNKKEMIKVLGQLVSKQQSITEYYYIQQQYTEIPALVAQLDNISCDAELKNKNFIEGLKHINKSKIGKIVKMPDLSGIQTNILKALKKGERRMKMPIIAAPSPSIPLKVILNTYIYIYIYIYSFSL